MNDELKAIADELGSARNIYEFVKNIISYETYNGSKKSAVMTFDHLGGNDVDQASLLIGMLRYKGIPARYAYGIVKITPEQAIDITGAADVLSAVDANTGSASFMLSKGRAGGEISANVRLVAKENGYENVGDLMDACYNVNEAIFIYMFGEGYEDMVYKWANMAVSGKESMHTNGYSVIMDGKVIADGFNVLYTSAADYMDYAISSSEKDASKMLNHTLENVANLVIYKMERLKGSLVGKCSLSYGPIDLTGGLPDKFNPDTTSARKMLGSLISILKNNGKITSEDINDIIKGRIKELSSY